MIKRYRNKTEGLKLLVVTEGGKVGGLGHIQRCLAISQAFAENGIKSRFFVNGGESISDAFKEKNHEIWNWLEKRNEFFKLAKKVDIVIIDSYLSDAGFYKRLSELVEIPVYIDDNKRLDYPRGIVINSGIYAPELKYPRRRNITYLLGNRYAPLRRLFWEIRDRKVKDEIETVMVTTGGHDPKNVMPGILRFLRINCPDLKKDIIIGNAFENVEEIKKEADKNTNLIYSPDTKQMKRIMLRSDIAISSGGQTLFELARVGVPTIAFRQAENQRLNLEAWDKEGFVEYAGDYNNFEKKISRSLKKLSSKQERLKHIGVGIKLVDGQGARRIKEAILNYENQTL